MGRDLKSKQAIYLKAILFIVILIISVILNIITDELKIRIFSIILIVWSSARIYYFMFYVIENYVDKEFKFSSIYSFVKYLFK